MAEQGLEYDDLHGFLKDLKIEPGKRATRIKGATTGRYTQPEIIQDAYNLEGGANLSFTKKGALRILGGVTKVRASKEKLDEFIKTAELSDEERLMYTYLSEQLGEYITRKEEYARRKKEKAKNKESEESKDDKDEEVKDDKDEEVKDDKDEEVKDDKDEDVKDDKDEEVKDDKDDKDPKKDEKGNVKMDLNEVKKQMEAFEEEAKGIRKEGEFEAIAAELAAAAREVANHKRRIEEYQYELDHLDTRYMDVVEENRTKGTIKELIKEEQEKLANAEKAEADVKQKEEDTRKSLTTDAVKKAESDLRDRKSKYYTQAQMKIDTEIRKVKHEMEGILISLNEFQYEYEEGTRIPTNGEAVKELNKQYHGLQDKLKDLQDAKALCAEQKALVQAEFEAAVAKINEIISRKDAEPVEEKKDEKAEEAKDEKAEEVKDEKAEEVKDEKAEEVKDDKDEEVKDDKDEEVKDDKDEEVKDEDEEEKDEEVDFEVLDDSELPTLDGELIYDRSNFWARYLLKSEAYKLDHPDRLDEDGRIGFFDKLRLLFPNAKYRSKAERGITLGHIDVEKTIGYMPDEFDDYEDAEFDDYEEVEFEEEDIFTSRYGAKTPDASKGKGAKGKTEPENDREDR